MERYRVGASMEVDLGEDEPQARWDWCTVRRVFGYFHLLTGQGWRHRRRIRRGADRGCLDKAHSLARAR